MVHGLTVCIITRKKVKYSHQRSGLSLNVSVSRRTNVSSCLNKKYNVSVSSQLFASRAQDVILPKLVWIKGTEYCTDFLIQSEQGVYAWSSLYVIAPSKLILCIIIINGRENKVTTAVSITRRPGLF